MKSNIDYGSSKKQKRMLAQQRDKDQSVKQHDDSQAYQPPLNITYAPSEFHPVAPQMDWEFLSWPDDQTMLFQLDFDKPPVVSMELPNDNIEITFKNQSFFLAQDDSYVAPGQYTQKIIRP